MSNTTAHQLSPQEESRLLAREEKARLQRMQQAGFHSALAVFLDADESGGHKAWIIENVDGAPPVRQRATCLLNELSLHERYHQFYEKALDTEAEATHYYIDQLACRACQLARLKQKERCELEVAIHIGDERRMLEDEELRIRNTLQDSYSQSIRLIGREMLAKRSLLSSAEYRAQVSRVAHHVDTILQRTIDDVVL